MGKTPEPLTAGEVSHCFEQTIGSYQSVVLAVSGGPDSMALMHLAKQWCDAHAAPSPSLSVITIDHSLRPESRAEAEFVAAEAAKIGLQHSILTWDGPRPSTGLQEAARNARYALIGAHMQRHRIEIVVTAHTLDDQAETLLMRLARGSGVDGLAGMKPVSRVMGDICIARPLLGIPKHRLIATLKARSILWIEDPSNVNSNFERVRLRAALPVLEDLGLTTKSIGLAAQRLARARSALDSYATGTVRGHPDKIQIDTLGFARLDWDFVKSVPEEVAIRILQRIIQYFGGQKEPVSLSQLEDMTVNGGWPNPAGRTLAGAQFIAGKMLGEVFIVREHGRAGLPELETQPGGVAEWDNRFTVALSKDLPRPLSVAALGAKGLGVLKGRGHVLPDAPREAFISSPALFAGEALVAAPLCGYIANGYRSDGFRVNPLHWPFPF